MPINKEIQVWWHGIAALPADRHNHAYHTLRRVWGDHTMAGGRSFYRTSSEDHITPTLFQNWALFPDPKWAIALVRAAGGCAGTITRVRWAYACEEVIDARLQPFHARNFIIPDIMLLYEDEHGLGLIGFEVKKPGKATEASDDRKLKSYIDLPSTRRIARRYGCLLVSERMAERSRQACSGNWPVLTWERLGEMQVAAAYEASISASLADQVANWIGWHFKRHGVDAVDVTTAPDPAGVAYGTEAGYREIDHLPVPESMRRFLRGSECLEAVWRDGQPEPPLPWLAEEPAAERIRQRKWQTTEDRRICRWSFDWAHSRERTWC